MLCLLIPYIAIRQNLSLDYENFRVQLNTKYDSPLLGFGPTNLMDENNHFIPATEAKEINTFKENGVDLVQYRNPCPVGKVRGQWLCHLNVKPSDKKWVI